VETLEMTCSNVHLKKSQQNSEPVTNKQTNKQSSENSFAAFVWRRGGGGKAMGVMKKPLTGVKGSYKIMFDPFRYRILPQNFSILRV